jgi:hypothetical protein
MGAWGIEAFALERNQLSLLCLAKILYAVEIDRMRPCPSQPARVNNRGCYMPSD